MELAIALQVPAEGPSAANNAILVCSLGDSTFRCAGNETPPPPATTIFATTTTLTTTLAISQSPRAPPCKTKRNERALNRTTLEATKPQELALNASKLNPTANAKAKSPKSPT